MSFSRFSRKLGVRTVGDPVLRAVAAPVVEISAEIVALAKAMEDAVRRFDGVGLAAPQVGHSLRMVTFDVPESSISARPTPGELLLLGRMPLTVINPEVVAVSDEMSWHDEGCLSVPDFYAPVKRPARVVLRCSTLDGERIECECGGLLGRCVQHEIDHLDGKLFTDRLDAETAAETSDELKRVAAKCKKNNSVRLK